MDAWTSMDMAGALDFYMNKVWFQISLQNTQVLGHIFLSRIWKNAAIDGLKLRFKKTWLKETTKAMF